MLKWARLYALNVRNTVTETSKFVSDEEHSFARRIATDFVKNSQRILQSQIMSCMFNATLR